MADRIPIVVLGGWLGSGKTTLVNRLLARGGNGRVAVIVNDVGEINIDASLVASHDGDTIELTDGCICCSIGPSLAVTLRDLVLGEHPPDRIVVEASGVAEPAAVAAYGSRAHLAPQGAVVTVDATDAVDRVRDRRYGELARRQIEQADLLVLTKTDLASEGAQRAATDLCEEVAPATPVRLATPEALTQVAAAGRPSPSSIAPPGPDVVTATWRARGPVDPGAVGQVLERSGLLRAKGHVAARGGGLAEVQLAAGRVRVAPAGHGAEPALVLIGPDRSSVAEVLAQLDSVARGSRAG